MAEDRMADDGVADPSGEAGRESAAGEDAGEAKEPMSDKFSSASEKIRNSYSQAREKVGETYSSARDRMEQIDYDDLLENLRTYVRSNPGKALLISVGTGFLIGLLLRRAGEEEDDD